MSYREQLVGYIWDAYKDVNGIRPRWIDFDGSDINALEALADDLQREIYSESTRHEQQEQMECFALHHPNGFTYYESGEFYGVIRAPFQPPKFSEVF